jgi:hypothetical protein
MPKGKSNPEVFEKEKKVLELRRGGLTFDLIAERLGYANASGAQKAYERACSRIVYDDVVALRNAEMDRLDIAQAAIWNEVLQGRIQAVIALMKIMERRARLLGLDMPVKTQLEVTHYDRDTIDAEVQRLVALLDSEQTRKVDTPVSQTRTNTD